jgi:predicted peroxiredoxin
MKLTEEKIWKCNQTINYEKGEVVDGVHICLEHQNVVDFARAIEREIGFDRAELWIKRINDAVLAEREACAKAVEAEAHMFATIAAAKSLADAVRARGQA